MMIWRAFIEFSIFTQKLNASYAVEMLKIIKENNDWIDKYSEDLFIAYSKKLKCYSFFSIKEIK